MDSFIKIRRDLHLIPELGFQEFKTQAYLLDYLSSLNQERMVIDTWRTGIFVRVKGLKSTRTIGYRTDIDGLPMKENTGLEFSSIHEGNMHACGHDVHMSIALGVLTNIVNEPIDDDVVFIFQPAEEGPGGAEPLLKSEEFKPFKPDVIYGLHIAPEYPVGTIATKPGMLFAHTSELFIDFHGLSGHAAFPHLTNDMIVASSHFITQVQSVVSRNVNPLDSAVITIGKITGGTVQNVIADHVRIEGTMRALSEEAMLKLKNRIESLVNGFQESFQCKIEVDFGSNYYGVINDESLTNEFFNFAKQYDGIEAVLCNVAMTGEDFGYMTKEIPGLMFWIGVNSEFGLHNQKLNPDENVIPLMIRFISDFMKKQQ
ncbi:N-acetyldiaminopimelate deacetylase [Bacillus sp. FJAT-25509]|uniref:N-acetyldiaminopimelate deacetylase n=1 Tax=Bacillaceae TaxID=186817 RepID=UPI0006F93C28|nr:N-acetyldiaminopimelate deacetylase [Bacillus sp. FJAT-25509]KQL40370.1 N-acetyldiaminopimelate deacetylase [Bacillus sp. FJAT-25509]